MTAICKDPQQALTEAVLPLAGDGAAFFAISSKPWASATFTGRKFRMVLRTEGEDSAGRAAVLGRMLPRHDFAIPGQIVADVQVEGPSAEIDKSGMACAQLVLTVLTVEDW